MGVEDQLVDLQAHKPGKLVSIRLTLTLSFSKWNGEGAADEMWLIFPEGQNMHNTIALIFDFGSVIHMYN